MGSEDASVAPTLDRAEVVRKLDARLRELDEALQATNNIATRYDIKVRIEELRAIVRLLL